MLHWNLLLEHSLYFLRLCTLKKTFPSLHVRKMETIQCGLLFVLSTLLISYNFFVITKIINTLKKFKTNNYNVESIYQAQIHMLNFFFFFTKMHPTIFVVLQLYFFLLYYMDNLAGNCTSFCLILKSLPGIST